MHACPTATQNTATHLLVKVSAQSLTAYFADRKTTYTISTAKNGIGNRQDSLQTPLGWHSIKEKIGNNAEKMTVFKARKPIGKHTANTADSEENLITTRILWLQGEEKEKNKGGLVDSAARYIYIHGTNHESRLGKPVSNGCIHMGNDDIITLFDQVEVGSRVLIEW